MRHGNKVQAVVVVADVVDVVDVTVSSNVVVTNKLILFLLFRLNLGKRSLKNIFGLLLTTFEAVFLEAPGF